MPYAFAHYISNYTEVPMSEEHMEDFTGWQRPAELLRTRHEGNAIGQGLSEPSMLASGAIDLVQDVTADCSVVASLCAALARPHTTYVDVGGQASFSLPLLIINSFCAVCYIHSTISSTFQSCPTMGSTYSVSISTVATEKLLSTIAFLDPKRRERYMLWTANSQASFGQH